MTTFDHIKLVFTNLTIADPCKRCLVKAACSEQCDEKYIYWERTGEMPVLTKVLSLIIIFGSLEIVYSLYAFISDIINN